jgi:DNA mismatch repair protein MutS
MAFYSILFERPEDESHQETIGMPDFFVDLNLDQVIDSITIGKQDYNLKPFFYMPLHTIDAIRYRHEIMQDLEHPQLFEHIQSFAKNMDTMRRWLAQADKLYYTYQKERWFLDAVETYCEAIEHLVHDVSQIDLHSRGFLAFRDYLTTYAHSERFTSLFAETRQLKADLSSVKYCLLIKSSSIKVRKYEGESDYSAEVEATFAKFKQGAVEDYRVKFRDWSEMNHVEAQILEAVARLYPDIFSHLDNYCTRNRNYLDKTIATFDREIQFYLAYLEYIARFKRKGLPFCYPLLSTTRKEEYDYDGFDIALANTLIHEGMPIVCNDFSLQGEARIIVVTGPNQGGKTTFARAFGQIHYLASLGCLVPGREAHLFLCDQLFTHFEKEETITDLRGKLEDDLFRMNQIFKLATSNSLLLLNETFSSTTLDDQLFLSKKILEHIMQLDALCVCVTFLDELTRMSKKIISMVSTVGPSNPAERTFKIVKKPADGLAYAVSIAEKYRLTYHNVKERIPS